MNQNINKTLNLETRVFKYLNLHLDFLFAVLI